MPPQFQKQLQEFISSPADFRVIFNTSSTNQFVASNTRRVCILDSSFNPPHLGHYALIKESISKTYSNTSHHEEKPDQRVILLLLSVNNADKTNAIPESFEHRLEMMHLMALDLAKKYPQTQNISIGLTKHAKFVDKSVSILKTLDIPDIRLTFLVGFDTLVRIFNPKYYLPDKISSSLEEFMKSTDIFCLTRNDGEISHLDQSQYLKDIREGKHSHIPTHWSENISVHENFGDTVEVISSSNVRNSIQKNEPWEDSVIPEVKQIILAEKFYHNAA